MKYKWLNWREATEDAIDAYLHMLPQIITILERQNNPGIKQLLEDCRNELEFVRNITNERPIDRGAWGWHGQYAPPEEIDDEPNDDIPF
jgi:hypothetical protein